MPKPHSDRYIFLRVPHPPIKNYSKGNQPIMIMNENTTPLHPAFLTRMKEMLGNEYPAFLSSFSAPRTYGLRINTSKITCEDFENLSPFPIRQIPWIKNGYFYDEDIRPSRCPYYQACLLYTSPSPRDVEESRMPSSA